MRSAIARWIHLTNNIVPLGIPEPTQIIQSDASLRGYGFVINSERYQGTFDQSMRIYSINVLELLAIWMATLMIQEENIVLRIMTDNTAALAAINRATSVTYHLAALAEMIWKRASALKWAITAVHIRGMFNVIADQLSRNTVISTE